MNHIKRIVTNTITLGISEVITKLGLFFIFIYLARSFDKAAFGRFNFAYAFSLIAVILIDLGINYMLIREASRNKSKIGKYIGNSFLIKLSLSVIIFSLIYFVMSLSNYPLETRLLVYLISAYAFFKSFTELLFTVFKAYERMHYESILKILRIVMLTSIFFTFVFLKFSIIYLAFAFTITELIVLFISFIIISKKFTKIDFTLDVNLSKVILKKASPFTLSLVFASIYFYIDTIMLSLMRGDVEVGIYSAAYNLTLAILFIPGMYIFAIYPILSTKFDKSKKTAVLLYERSFKYLFILGVPVSMGFFILSRQIILFIYGPNYFQSVLALQVLSGFIFIKFISYLTGIILSSINKQKLRMYSQGTAAITNLILNLILIPKLGFIGAGLSTLVSEAVLFFMTYFFVSKYFHKFRAFKNLTKPLIASIIMAIIVYYADINAILRIILGIFTYLFLIVMLKAFDKRDISFLKRLVPNGN